MQEGKNIFLLVQSGYSAKNFVLSGFLNQEKAKITFWSDQDYIAQYNIDNKIVKLPKYDYDGKLNFIQKIKNKAELFFNVKTFKNKDYLFYLIGINKNNNLKLRLKKIVITIIAKVFSTQKGIEYLDQPFYKATRKTSYYKACKTQLLKHKPSVVFCTHQRASSGVAPMLAAKDLGIRTICFIHSWDNIPKGVQLIKADEYFVWSSYMKKEMLTHYPFLESTHIKITGTPQFVPYFDKNYLLQRADFLSQFNLETAKKFILFSGNDKTTSPNDPVFLQDLCKAVLQLNSNEDNYRIIFRPNPIDRNDGFDEVLAEYPNLITELKPEWFGSETFLWNKGGPSKSDLVLLVNTIFHSELVVNMGSTMALDAALLGKPSCYINYDVESNYNWTVKRIYRFIHFDMIKKINPVFWINKREDVYNVVKDALENPVKTLAGREQWIKTITTLPIEDTNKRMWNFILNKNEV
ncbi:glycosyltransferase family protein [Polaribacter butkevichii]|uniref:UDP-glycosyltransferase n=1 Tax=Polaribacter butkevichii TaxID=218490 RepID=A0A2P6CEK9_9FLAO|nr:hypothetical protein [Polaribacter butkevichii]PQJ73308.1 hypothetical protein BTO14_08560 [Polaribacter butkevichii]